MDMYLVAASASVAMSVFCALALYTMMIVMCFDFIESRPMATLIAASPMVMWAVIYTCYASGGW